ncbi:hypothetical protein U1Q18_021207 [Sarracenia purpurea var. burkii]
MPMFGSCSHVWLLLSWCWVDAANANGGCGMFVALMFFLVLLGFLGLAVAIGFRLYVTCLLLHLVAAYGFLGHMIGFNGTFGLLHMDPIVGFHYCICYCM